MRDEVARVMAVAVALSIALAAGLALGSSDAASAADTASDRADRLAGAIYFEGLALADARDLSDADVARLIERLADPAALREHPNALTALGMSGARAAFDAIDEYAQRGSSGELGRLEFRALRAIPYAMGHLARADERALAWLMRAAADAGDAPQRSFRQLDPARFARLQRRAAITGLALSGQPAAARLLNEMRASPREEAALASHCAEALRVHERIAREGAAAALRTEFEIAQ